MPTTTTGVATTFIDFTRASNATVTDSDGKVKWAPHNLLLASESFDAASWLKTNAGSTTPTVTANAAVAPNGTTTAETVALGAIDAAGDTSVVYQTFTAVDATYRGGVYVKAATGGDVGKKVWMFMYDSAYRGVASVTLTTEWQLLSATATLTAGANREFYIATIGSTNGGENQVAVSVHLWGAHLYRSDLAMQPNTSAYPMYNPTTPKNFAGFTEDFRNAAWSKPNVTIQANATIAPNGLNTADLVYPSSTGVARTVYQSSLYRCVSVYAKGAGKTFLFAQNGGNTVAWFNLATGAKGTVIAGYTADMTPEANGFYRCSVIKDTTSFAFIEFGISDADNSNSVTANGTDGIYLWGAQLSDSASLDSYVPVYGAAVTSAAYYGPRRDFDGATLACNGLLVEESRTNLASLSNSFSAASWAKDNSSAAVSSATNSPDGLANSSLWYATSSGSVISARLLREISGATIGTVYTASIYVKAAGKRWLYFTSPDASSVNDNCWFDIQNGVVGTKGSSVTSASITPCGNGWYRVTTTATATSTSQYFYLSSTNADNSSTVTANATDGFYFYGAQMEAGSFSTSYIPTGSTSATRTYDLATVSTQAFPYSSTEGTLVMATQYAGVGTTFYSYYTALTAGGGVDNLAAITTDSGTLSARVRSSSSDSLNASFASAAVGGVKKVGIALKANDFATVLNGGAAQISTTGAMPVGVITLNMNIYNSGAQWIRQITYLPRRVTNAELQTRTA